MKVLSLLVLLVAQAQSQSALLSGSPVAASGQSYAFEITMSECAEVPTQSDFSISGASVSGFECNGNSQSFTCSFIPTGASSFTVQHTSSNVLAVSFLTGISGTFTSAVVKDGNGILITYDCGLECAAGSGSFVISNSAEDATPLVLWSIEQTGSSVFEIVVQNKGQTSLFATAQANAVVDPVSFGINSEFSTTLQVSSTRGGSSVSDGPACQFSDWSAWSKCSDVSCDSFDKASFSITSGFKSRTRTVVSGSNCVGDLAETKACAGAVSALCEDQIKKTFPRPGEHRGLCSNCAATDQDGGNPFKEKAGCYCDVECVNRGDCCQAFFFNDCCAEGADCTTVHADKVYGGQFPLACSVEDCFFDDAKAEAITGVTPSYWCSCGPECRSEGTCCDGSVERENVCGAL